MANNILHSSTSDSESKNTSTDSTLFNEKFPFQLRQDFASRITEDESDFFKWKKIRELAFVSNHKEWNKYDLLILKSVNEINIHLSSTPYFQPLDWYIIKAMLWTENDAENTSQWNGYPLQIGRFRKDKAMPALISGEKSTALVTPPQWRNKAFNGLKDPERNYWAKEQITGSPEENIKAAITYLMMKLSNTKEESTIDQYDSTLYSAIVQKGDLADNIRTERKTTIPNLTKNNPGKNLDKIHPGDILYYQKASMKVIITGWKPITIKNVAMNYNGGGDPKYAIKLQFVYTLLTKNRVL